MTHYIISPSLRRYIPQNDWHNVYALSLVGARSSTTVQFYAHFGCLGWVSLGWSSDFRNSTLLLLRSSHCHVTSATLLLLHTAFWKLWKNSSDRQPKKRGHIWNCRWCETLTCLKHNFAQFISTKCMMKTLQNAWGTVVDSTLQDCENVSSLWRNSHFLHFPMKFQRKCISQT